MKEVKTRAVMMAMSAMVTVATVGIGVGLSLALAAAKQPISGGHYSGTASTITQVRSASPTKAAGPTKVAMTIRPFDHATTEILAST